MKIKDNRRVNMVAVEDLNPGDVFADSGDFYVSHGDSRWATDLVKGEVVLFKVGHKVEVVNATFLIE